jgi:hypothetical protein
MQTNPLVLQQKIATSFKNSFQFKDLISPEETGISNSLIAAVLQRPLSFQGNHYKLFKKRKKNLTGKSYSNTKNNTFGPETCKKCREKHDFVQFLDTLKTHDEEFRRNPKLIGNHSILIELHQGSSSNCNSQYFTKKFQYFEPDIPTVIRV